MKVWKWLKKVFVKDVDIKEGPIHHGEPIPVDPPIKPKEEEK